MALFGRGPPLTFSFEAANSVLKNIRDGFGPIVHGGRKIRTAKNIPIPIAAQFLKIDFIFLESFSKIPVPYSEFFSGITV